MMHDEAINDCIKLFFLVQNFFDKIIFQFWIQIDGASAFSVYQKIVLHKKIYNEIMS